jgi:hypothetical protein
MDYYSTNTWRGVNGPNATGVTGTQTPPGLPQIGGGPPPELPQIGGGVPQWVRRIQYPTPPWWQVPEIISKGAGASYQTIEEALESWGRAVFQATTTGNKEYAGLIYQRGPFHGNTWSYTPALQGDESSSKPENQFGAAIMDGAIPTRIYAIHSHGSAQDPIYGQRSEYFSSHGPNGHLGGDMGKSARDGKIQFLLTPRAHIKELIPKSFSNLTDEQGEVYDLGSIFGSLRRPWDI